MKTRLYTVFVYNHHVYRGTKGHINHPLAYTRYQGINACKHVGVYGLDGTDAKKIAIREHLRSCSQIDNTCTDCPGLS